MDALIKTKNTVVITKSTAISIEGERKVTPKNMVTLINKRPFNCSLQVKYIYAEEY